jgi:DNA-cytosine methyltransferase
MICRGTNDYSKGEKLNYLSVCSGVEAATVAWHSLGWNPVAFSEIEPFPSAVLAHHYPHVPNLGDMTKYKEWKLNEPIDLLVGGTPCQSFSVAGLRKGMDDPRGNLALVYLGIADKFKPKWIVWENVPGVLSSKGGRDFGSFLGALGELGYGFAYRVLDAQHFGVPQRRRRVFVVGCLGDWRSAAAVLFEQESLLGNPKKSRSKGQETPATASSSSAIDDRSAHAVATRRRNDPTTNTLIPCTPDGGTTIGSLLARDYKGVGNQDLQDGRGLIVYENHPSDSRVKEMGDVCQTVTSTWGTGGGNIPFVGMSLPKTGMKAYTLQGGGATSQNSQGMGWNEDISFTLNNTDVHGVAIAFEPGIAQREGGDNRFVEDKSPTLRSNMGDNQVAAAYRKSRRAQSTNDYETWVDDGKANTINTFDVGDVRTTHAIAVDVYNQAIDGDVTATLTEACGGTNTSGPKVIAPTLTASNNPSRSPQSTEVTNQVASVYAATMAVRRLTPIECERLQGFPDNHTMIPWRKKPAEDCPDGPRYKAMGNSMAVPVMNWIGKRIQMVQS